MVALGGLEPVGSGKKKPPQRKKKKNQEKGVGGGGGRGQTRGGKSDPHPQIERCCKVPDERKSLSP